MGFPLIVAGAAAAPFVGAASNLIGAAIQPDVVTAGQVAFWQWPVRLPDADVAINLYLRGLVSDPKWVNSICKSSGVNFLGTGFNLWGKHDQAVHKKAWDRAADAYRSWLPPEALARLRNRGFINEPQYYNWLLHFGAYRDDQLQTMLPLRFELPPISDVIRYAVKEVFTPTTPGHKEMREEFPPILENFARAQGYGSPGEASNDPELIKTKDSVAMLEWLAHYFPISPTQSYEMFHRIREDNIKEWQNQGFKVEPFLLKHVEQRLRIQDYPPDMRPYLAAISYRVIGRIDVRKMVRAGYWDDKERVRKAYLDMGYSPPNAKELAEYTWETEFPGNKISAAYTRFRSQILTAYKVGTIDRTNARGMLMNPFLGKPNELQISKDTDMYLDSVDIQASHEVVKRAINAVRDDYLEGSIDAIVAAQQLESMGLSTQRRDQYLKSWKIDLTRPRRVLSISNNISLYVKGIISRDELNRRGLNLGYSATDVSLMIASADQDISKAITQQQLREEKAQKAAIKEAHREADHARLHGVWQRMDVAAVTPPTLLGKEYREEIIDESVLRTRLQQLDWPNEWIDRFERLNRPQTAGT